MTNTSHGVRKALWSVPLPQCWWCSISLIRPRRGYDNTLFFIGTVEHLVPVSLGGQTTVENCVLACKKCNEERGNPNDPWQGPNGIRKHPPVLCTNCAGLGYTKPQESMIAELKEKLKEAETTIKDLEAELF